MAAFPKRRRPPSFYIGNYQGAAGDVVVAAFSGIVVDVGKTAVVAVTADEPVADLEKLF